MTGAEVSSVVTTRRYDVAIVGGSFAGLALGRALALAVPGLSVAVIERADPVAGWPGADVRASALAAGSIRLLQAIGVWRLVRDAAEPMTSIEITDSSLGDAVRPVLVAYDNILDDGTPATQMMPNGALLDGLVAAAKATPGLEFVAPAKVESFAFGDARARIMLRDGRAIDATLLVAADGRGSALRTAAGIKTVGWDYPQIAIVTTVAHERAHNGGAVQHFLPGGPFAILPLKGNRACITWSEDATEARRILALDDAAFEAELQKRFGWKLGIVRVDGARQSFPLAMHLARSLVAPRVAIIGDAAHGVHPIAGQGLNLGLRDVAALVEVIADAARLGLDIGSLLTLERYERWRRLDGAMSAAGFDALNRVFSNDATVLRTARSAGLGLVERIPALKSFFVTEAAGLTGDTPKLLGGVLP
jgi:2-octaprenyl-6-methoxyphenol hydroxylase